MSRTTYHKPPISFADQLQQLIDRNLTVNDPAKAIEYLSQINYYRLSAYFLPYQQVKDTFDQGTTFKQIIDTYSFDRELRLLVFDCIERIEIAIRTQFIYCMAIEYADSHWQDNNALFKTPYTNHVGRPIDPYSDFQRIITRAKNARRPEVFIKHYTDNYHTPSNPPSWMCFELLTIGELSWNKDLAIEPLRLARPVGPWVGSPYSNNSRMFYFLCVLKYLLLRVNPGNRLKDKLIALFAKYPNVPIKYMGIPSDGNGNLLKWENEPIWQ